MRLCASLLCGPHQATLVLIAYASSEGSGEPAHPRSLARTSATRSYKQWVKRNLQTESQIPAPSEWLGMRSQILSWRNPRRNKFAWRGPCIIHSTVLSHYTLLFEIHKKKKKKNLQFSETVRGFPSIYPNEKTCSNRNRGGIKWQSGDKNLPVRHDFFFSKVYISILRNCNEKKLLPNPC